MDQLCLVEDSCIILDFVSCRWNIVFHCGTRRLPTYFTTMQLTRPWSRRPPTHCTPVEPTLASEDCMPVYLPHINVADDADGNILYCYRLLSIVSRCYKQFLSHGSLIKYHDFTHLHLDAAKDLRSVCLQDCYSALGVRFGQLVYLNFYYNDVVVYNVEGIAISFIPLLLQDFQVYQSDLA